MEREVGGGIGMGNTCKPMAVSFQCMTKSTTNKKKKMKKKRTLNWELRPRSPVCATDSLCDVRQMMTPSLKLFSHLWHKVFDLGDLKIPFLFSL